LLTYLSVRNFAIIDHLELSLSPGFTALTGETGAGKSIIIDAVGLLLGGRADADYIRAGTEQALIEAAFEPSQASYQEVLAPLLKEHGLVDPDQENLILAREINRQARNVCRVNGRLVTLSLLRQIGENLVDIHNQGEHLSLLRVHQHVDFLDRYAGLEKPRREIAGAVRALQETRRQLKTLFRDERELARRMDLLEYQVNEIEAARLQTEEEEDLTAQHKLLTNAEWLIAQSDLLYRTLSESEGTGGSVLDRLGEVSEALAKLAQLDPRLASQQTAIDETSYQLADVAATLRRYADEIDYNPDALAQVEERLNLIHDLKRKYGNSITEVVEFAHSAAEELHNLSRNEERIEELQARESGLLATIARLAAFLSEERQRTAGSLAQRMESELAELGMQKARFSVSISQREAEDGVPVGDKRYAFDSTGIDDVEFLISPNVGEPLKPLSKIASGGETARLMLAMKTVLSAVDEVPVLIFDEIDAGLGGRAGAVVGRKLWGLARNHQVLSVTHLPQIAAYGDSHYLVGKQVRAGRTLTVLERLEAEERTRELAQMLGTETDATHLSAEEMRADVENWKANQQG
jgi:DNA repair protein RecN (Recombination protein N)